MKTTASTDNIEKGLALFVIITILGRLSSLGIFDTLFVVAGFSMILYYSLRLFISFRDWNRFRMETLGSVLVFVFALVGIASITSLHAFLPAGAVLWASSLMIALLVSIGTGFIFLSKNRENPTRWIAWAKGAFPRFFIILFALLVSLAIGWDTLFQTYFPERYNVQESYIDYHAENGAKKTEGYLLNGKPDSLWRYYSPNGDTLKVENYGGS